MFHLKVISCLAFLSFLLVNADKGTTWPDNLKTEFSFLTPAPAKIHSSKAVFYHPSTPLKLTIPTTFHFYLKNTGTTVEATQMERAFMFTITGGVLGQEVYDFHRLVFSWNHEYTDFTGNSIDNGGTALRPFLIFYKREYKSMENARQHRDGIVGLIVKVDVEGVVPNKNFGEFEKVLHELTKFNSTTSATVQNVTSWFGTEPLRSYYVYPGSYHTTGNSEERKYNNAITIEYPKSGLASISIEQFHAFNQLKNQYGSPVESRVSSFPMGERPLFQAPDFIFEALP